MTNSSGMPERQRLKFRLIRRAFRVQLITVVLVLIPAGSLKFWQGCVYFCLGLILQFWFMFYFYRRDPQTLERRLLTQEKNSGQKVIIVLLRVVAGGSLVLAGLDYRFGWTRTNFSPVPVWLTVLALLAIIGTQWLFIQILEANRFASSIIQVETGQTIAATGPYRFVRHPMYLTMIIYWLAAPLALGSVVALAAGIFVIPVLALRLLNEERILRRDLPGYADYCRQTRCRLVPFVW